MREKANPIYLALKNNSASPELLKQAAEISLAKLDGFLSIIDESPYEINEWAQSIMSFEEWAIANRRTLEMDHKIEYLSCCLEGARGGVNLPLAFLLSEYLKTHGVE